MVPIIINLHYSADKRNPKNIAVERHLFVRPLIDTPAAIVARVRRYNHRPRVEWVEADGAVHSVGLHLYCCEAASMKHSITKRLDTLEARTQGPQPMALRYEHDDFVTLNRTDGIGRLRSCLPSPPEPTILFSNSPPPWTRCSVPRCGGLD